MNAPSYLSFSKVPLAVNWHMLEKCNYRCKFCFAKFGKVPEICNDLEKSKLILRKLRGAGVKKINFTGGEPLLCRNLGELVKHAKELGMATSIVTNGYYLPENVGREFLENYGRYLDWIGISLDSGREEVEKALGRGYGDHVRRVIEAVKLIKTLHPHIGIKINTVVTKLNYREDMHRIIGRISPDRWKVFQLKVVPGVNEESKALGVTKEEFREFVERHRDLNPIAEDNELMTESYLMMDPYGRFYDEESQLENIRPSLLDAPFEVAISGVKFDFSKFVLRGGVYNWRRVKDEI
jgi:radical S-adenosyl methionine domain-containing protein 2